jgi:hypothetical protein
VVAEPAAAPGVVRSEGFTLAGDASQICKNNPAHNVGNCCLNFRQFGNQQKNAKRESVSLRNAEKRMRE